MEAYLGTSGEIMVGKFAFEAVFVHNPVALLTFGRSASVENEGFLHTNKGTSFRAVNFPILTGCLPVTGFGCSISPQTSWIFPIS